MRQRCVAALAHAYSSLASERSDDPSAVKAPCHLNPALSLDRGTNDSFLTVQSILGHLSEYIGQGQPKEGNLVDKLFSGGLRTCTTGTECGHINFSRTLDTFTVIPVSIASHEPQEVVTIEEWCASTRTHRTWMSYGTVRFATKTFWAAPANTWLV